MTPTKQPPTPQNGNDADSGKLFSPLTLRNVILKNRIIRAATYEGMADADGVPGDALVPLYRNLAAGGAGAIITGFVYVSQAGRAMQPRQGGIDNDEKTAAWQNIVAQVKSSAPDVRLFMQLAHAGRQTRQTVTGLPVYGVSPRRCTYFRQKTTMLSDHVIESIIEDFAMASSRAQAAGFDGIQLHAAHGYLIHQFLSPWTNTRHDRWGEPTLFLKETVSAVKAACGDNYPVLVKLSATDDNAPGIRIEDTIKTVKCLEVLGIDAVEISYGTMEYALNIIRGACPVDLVLRINPLFNRIPRVLQGIWKAFRADAYKARFYPFEEQYNAKAAVLIKQNTTLPVITVGGMRSLRGMTECLVRDGLDAVSLCRPLICEPDLPLKLQTGISLHSACTNCNRCTIYCDSPHALRCYRNERGNSDEN